MTTPKLDVLVFGASGFTGKFVVRYLSEQKWGKHPQNFTFGIAGRNREKLQEILDRFCGSRSHSVPIFIADCADPDSLSEMAKSCKVVVNCVGPYTLYGTPVVAACVAHGTSMLDLSGEPNYMASNRAKFSQAATESGSVIVSASGFDSVPNDFGFALVRKRLEAALSGGDKIDTIESFIETDTGPYGAGVHVTTLESLMVAVADWRFHWARFTSGKFGGLSGSVQRIIPHTDARIPGKVIVPFPGADSEIVSRTSGLSGDAGFKMGLYVALNSWTELALLSVGVVLLLVMAVVPYMSGIVTRHPKLFTGGIVSREGPSDKQRTSTSVLVHVFGQTTSGHQVNLVVDLKDPGYGATGAIIGQLAITLATRRDTELLPQYTRAGGVLTPGHAFVERNGEQAHVIQQFKNSKYVNLRFQ